MTQLVTLEQAKSWLGVIHSADDERIYFIISAASSAVLDYIDADASEVLGADGRADELLQAATLIMASKMYDGADPKELQYGRLPIEVTSLLYMRRQNLGIA